MDDELLYKQTGNVSDRAASQLYVEWVQEAGGEVCG